MGNVYRSLRFLISIVLLICLMGCQATAPQGTIATIVQTVSGDSLEISVPGGQADQVQRVRLIGIDAPELQQDPWGLRAKERLEQLLAGRSVLLESEGSSLDRFDRRLAYVWQGKTLLNEQLVLEGHALAMPRSVYPDATGTFQPKTRYDQRLANAQTKARILGLGIWNPAQPLREAPMEFRIQNK